MSDRARSTINDIVDDHWSGRIRKECSTGDPEVDHNKADGILEDLLKSMSLHKTLAAFQDLEKWYG